MKEWDIRMEIDLVGRADPAAVVNRYIAAFNAGDAAGIAALFAEDASVQDPIGTPSHIGRDAIARFYQSAIDTGSKLTLSGPIRVAGQHAAFPFRVQLQVDGADMTIDVIDTMRFDDAGRIEEIRAYFDTAGVPDFLT